MVKIRVIRIFSAVIQLFFMTALSQQSARMYTDGVVQVNDKMNRAENQAPQLVFDAPTQGFHFNAGEKIFVKISAFDADGTISKVELFSPHIDNGAVHTLLSAPFTYTYSNLPSTLDRGLSTLVARAYDNQGKVTELSMDVYENHLPEISLTSPLHTTRLKVSSLLTFSANASDPENNLMKVEFYVGAVKVGEDYSAPYSIGWKAIKGAHTLSAIAVDNFNGRATSNAASILVDE